MALRRTSSLLLVLLALTACTADGSDGADAPTTTAAAGAEPVGAEAVLAALRGSIALIDTPIATGSAVLLDDGHLVTNAHVVDPFGVADVTFEDGGTELDVPVVGVDLVTDLAVLGPIDTELDGVAIEDPSDLEQGGDLFLVGFPGDQEDPEVTISRGVLSRRRAAEGWGLDFLQSDTKIAPGQSGGALVDDTGRVVGISGLSDEDDFALTLSGADAAASIARILAGDGSAWEPAPTEADQTEVELTVAGAYDARTLYLPAAEDDRSLVVSVTGADPAVELDDVGGFPLALNELAHELNGGAEAGDGDLPDPIEPAADGSYTFELEGGFPALLLVGADVSGPTAVTVTTSEPFVVVAGDPEPTPIEVGGDPVAGTLGYLDEQEDFTLDLAAGESVDILVSSAIGNVAFAVTGPGISYDDAEEVDDGGGGLFDLDAEGTFTAAEAGTYELAVYQVEGAATAFRLTVEGA